MTVASNDAKADRARTLVRPTNGELIQNSTVAFWIGSTPWKQNLSLQHLAGLERSRGGRGGKDGVGTAYAASGLIMAISRPSVADDRTKVRSLKFAENACDLF